MAGLASDGGLYIPETWPRISGPEWVGMAHLPYHELAWRIMEPFIDGAIPESVMVPLLEETYRHFRHRAVAPLVQLEKDLWVLELFHGQTLAFKDFALQFLGRVMDYLLTQRGEQVNVVGATSGDTGAAAIAGLKGRKNATVFILHPKGRVSDVQRRMMTTWPDENIHNIAIEGTFDDCQDLVKAMFNDAAFRKDLRLAAVNSINWARILAQVVYYAYAALALGGPDVAPSFVVPTGNFGDIYAGYVARHMGLPIARLAVASNRNDVLPRLFQTWEYSKGDVFSTISPSIDIQISSNLERLLYDISGQDPAAVRAMLETFREKGRVSVNGPGRAVIESLFRAASVDETETQQAIRAAHEQSGYLADPHTAVGIQAAWKLRNALPGPVVCLATAHPAKFPDAVQAASGVHPALPKVYENLYDSKERLATLPNDVAAVQSYIREHDRN